MTASLTADQHTLLFSFLYQLSRESIIQIKSSQQLTCCMCYTHPNSGQQRYFVMDTCDGEKKVMLRSLTAELI